MANQLASENVHSKTYLSAITVSNIYMSFYLQDGGKNQLHNYGTKLRHCHPMYTVGLFLYTRARTAGKN